MDFAHQRMVATEPPTDLHRGFARQSGPEAHLPPRNLANPCSLLCVLHAGLPRARENGLTAQQHENLVNAKDQAKRYPGCLPTVSLDRTLAAQWAPGFGVHGVVNAFADGQ